MWAYLFWTVVAAWLFSIRPKRDGLDDSPGKFSSIGGHIQCCGGRDCRHTAGSPHPSCSVRPEKCTPTRRTAALNNGLKADDGWPSSGSEETACDIVLSESDRFHGIRRDLPPHMDRSFSPQCSPGSRRVSHNGKSKRCKLCQDVLPDFESLKVHLAQAHPRQNSSQFDVRSVSAYSTKLPYPCRFCGIGVDNPLNLRQHVAAKHPETLDPETRAHLLQCDDCGRIMGSEINLAGHKAQKHGTPAYVRGQSAGSDVCDVCNTAFDDDFQLRQHKGVHHMWSLFCKQCGIQFDHTHEAMAHYSKEHGARNIHPQRIQVFLDSLVVQEEEDEDPQRIFSCVKCGLDYSTRKELKQHYEDPFAHGTWGDQSPHFPPLVIAAPPSPPPLPNPVPMSSIDTNAQLPSFDLSPADTSSASVTPHDEEFDPVNPTFGPSASDRPASPVQLARGNYGAIGQPVKQQERINIDNDVARGSSLGLITPRSPLPNRSHESLYFPEMVGEIETTVPSFRMASPGSDTDSFPPIVPGPLPAPTKAPLSAWSKPLMRKGSPPEDRPLDHSKVPRYLPRGVSPSAGPGFSSPEHRTKPDPTRAHRSAYDRNASPSSYTRGDSPLSGSNTVSSASRTAWRDRGAPRSRTTSITSDTSWDTPASALRGGKPKGHDRKATKTGSESPKRGLEPIYDSTEWEVLGAPSKRPVAPVYQSIPVRCAEEDSRVRWAREAEERRQITEACVAAGGEDPFGGW